MMILTNEEQQTVLSFLCLQICLRANTYKLLNCFLQRAAPFLSVCVVHLFNCYNDELGNSVNDTLPSSDCFVFVHMILQQNSKIQPSLYNCCQLVKYFFHR